MYVQYVYMQAYMYICIYVLGDLYVYMYIPRWNQMSTFKAA